MPCLQGLDKFSLEKDVAGYIKNAFDSRYSPTWHCIVGRNFGGGALRRARHGTPPLTSPEPSLPLPLPPGSYVTHETKSFIYFYTGPTAVLLFKSG